MVVAISSGHSLYVSGAIRLVNEVTEARKMTDILSDLLDDVMKVHKFHDNVSRTQGENINRIVAWHNGTKANYHYSIHLNSSTGTHEREIGTEVFYKYDADKAHAADIAKAISEATGLKNRGAKKRTDLGFLSAPKRLLIELYFVNSKADVHLMDEEHEIMACATAIAKVICKQSGINFIQSPAKPCRMLTGTFTLKSQADKALILMDEHNIASKKYSKVVADGNKYRVQTGVFGSHADAQKQIDKAKSLGIIKVGNIVNP